MARGSRVLHSTTRSPHSQHDSSCPFTVQPPCSPPPPYDTSCLLLLFSVCLSLVHSEPFSMDSCLTNSVAQVSSSHKISVFHSISGRLSRQSPGQSERHLVSAGSSIYGVQDRKCAETSKPWEEPLLLPLFSFLPFLSPPHGICLQLPCLCRLLSLNSPAAPRTPVLSS